MSDLPGVVVMGCAGRMGQMLTDADHESDKLNLVGAVERKGSDWVGKDLGIARGGAALGVDVTDEPLVAIAKAQIVLDFTSPASTVALSELTAQARAVHVIGTTGMTDEDIQKLDAAARHAVIVRAGNMSLGVNLLLGLTKKIASALGSDFDVEIVESHHHQRWMRRLEPR